MQQTNNIHPVDELIIRGLRSQDKAIHDTCVHRFFYSELEAVISRIRTVVFKGTADYDEIVNELYLLLSADSWAILDSFSGRGGARLSTWVGTVALHHFLRKYFKEDRLESLDSGTFPLDKAGLEIITSDEIRLDVEKTIALMPNRRYAGVLSMNLIYGYSPEEIADILETTVSNVYNIKHRAIGMFLKIYKEGSDR